MTNEIQNVLTLLAQGRDLSYDEAARAFQIIMRGGATPVQMGAFLMGLRQKGETVDEIVAGAEMIRAKAPQVQVPDHAIDTCGTGGDAKGTLNISTATAIVVAACGVPVAKHGNRAVTSASGSADVFRELDINLEADIPVLERAIKECNLTFFMAPKFHTALRHVAPVRLELGLRTIFNLLGPLTNPARPKRQLLGVFARQWVRPMAEVLHRLNVEKAWVVCSSDGLDEIALSAPTHVAELEKGEIREFTITPELCGFEQEPLSALRGESAAHNARAVHVLLAGKHNAFRRVVLMNAAACLMIAGKVSTLSQGVDMAAEAIDSGRAKETLASLSAITNGMI